MCSSMPNIMLNREKQSISTRVRNKIKGIQLSTIPSLFFSMFHQVLGTTLRQKLLMCSYISPSCCVLRGTSQYTNPNKAASLSTWDWITYHGTHPWKRLTLPHCAAISCL